MNDTRCAKARKSDYGTCYFFNFPAKIQRVFFCVQKE